MPTKTFHHLKKEKKEKLVQSAMIEFSTVAYPKVSINKIIQSANIPRGSFYMYFQDKEDLFLYLIQLHIDKLKMIVKNNLILKEGRLEDAFISIYDEIRNKLSDFQYIDFFKNVFMFFNLNKEHFDYPGHILYTEVENLIYFENARVTDKEFVFHMFMQNLFSSLALSFKDEGSNYIKDIYIKKIDILCHGIFKKEEN